MLICLFHSFTFKHVIHGKLSWKEELCFILKEPLDMENSDEPESLGRFSKNLFLLGSVPDKVTDLHF